MKWLLVTAAMCVLSACASGGGSVGGAETEEERLVLAIFAENGCSMSYDAFAAVLDRRGIVGQAERQDMYFATFSLLERGVLEVDPVNRNIAHSRGLGC